MRAGKAQDVDLALTEALEPFQSVVALWPVSFEIGVERGDALQECFDAMPDAWDRQELRFKAKSKRSAFLYGRGEKLNNAPAGRPWRSGWHLSSQRLQGGSDCACARRRNLVFSGGSAIFYEFKKPEKTERVHHPLDAPERSNSLVSLHRQTGQSDGTLH